jgi:hypothetical protein
MNRGDFLKLKTLYRKSFYFRITNVAFEILSATFKKPLVQFFELTALNTFQISCGVNWISFITPYQLKR